MTTWLPLTSRADLARILAAFGGLDDEAALSITSALGLQLGAIRPARDGSDSAKADPGVTPDTSISRGRAPLKTETVDDLLPPRFWQPRRLEIVDPTEVTRFEHDLEDAIASPCPIELDRGEAPTPLQLSPWRRIGPLLQRALTRDMVGRALDIPALVRRWARGELAGRLPRRRRRAWSRVIVVVDSQRRLAPVHHDQAEVIARMKKEIGRDAVRVRRLLDGPNGLLLDEQRRLRSFHEPADLDLPLLVLSDLGLHGTARERAGWRRLGRNLRDGGRRVVALVPAAPALWERPLAGIWAAIPWERPRRVLLAPNGRPDTGTRLLALASPAMAIEPGLLRALRTLLPPNAADISDELATWEDPRLMPILSGARAIQPKFVEALRHRFLQEGDLRHLALEILRQWHRTRDKPPEVWHLEVLALDRLLADARMTREDLGLRHDEVAAAEQFILRLAGEIRRDGGREFSRDSLQGWLGFVEGQVPRSLLGSEAVAGRSFGIIRGVANSTSEPPPLHLQSTHRILQVGTKLVCVDDKLADREPRDAPRVGHLYGGEPRAVLTRERRRVRPHTSGPLSSFEIGEVVDLELRTESATLTLESLTPPPWARAIGRDRFGLWAEFFYQNPRNKRAAPVPYRMRWIPPGRFLMGSPDDEPGRYGSEGPQHLVVITRGYWLGETPVTQALWQAVTGDNPSEFKSPDRPVENVSWKECQRDLIARLNRDIAAESGERFRLPTEAEWEYACRAGTTTATYAGPIELRGENDAPILDDIAWYSGNSGVDFDLPEGRDSSGWPNKQHPHTKAGTRRVGQKLPNPWGLYDMLGNVWEWCSDWAHRSYGESSSSSSSNNSSSSGSNSSDSVVVDPTGPATGELRVIRGGSWDDHARVVRAAFRYAFDPGYRRANLGLRLAREQGVR